MISIHTGEDNILSWYLVNRLGDHYKANIILKIYYKNNAGAL